MPGIDPFAWLLPRTPTDDRKQINSPSTAGSWPKKQRIVKFADPGSEEGMLPATQGIGHSEDEIGDHDDDRDDDDDDCDDDGNNGYSTFDSVDEALIGRRQQDAVFDNFVARTVSDLPQRTLSGSASGAANGASESLKSIMGQQGSAHIIESPRDYQMELYERAKEKNTIAVLDTGAGKTLIAVLLLRHVLEEELERRAQGHPKRIAFFLVPKVVLTFQQFAVLETNLDHPIERMTGSTGSSFQKSTWSSLMENAMVAVSTPDCLLYALHHSFVKISEINLLIFDEAHHAKLEHPYARIINQYYRREKDPQKRPRLFGMTASPIDASPNDNLKEKVQELERLLDSTIATATHMALLQKAIHRPREELLVYSSLGLPFDTPLQEKLREKFGSHPRFRNWFEEGRVVARELGAWCGEFYWKEMLAESRRDSHEHRAKYDFYKSKKQASVEVLNEQMELVGQALMIASQHTLGEPHRSLLSAKVNALSEALSKRFERPTDIRCIVFVERRCTAKLLTKLFAYGAIGTPHLRPGLLIGSGGSDPDHISFKQQVVTLLKFRNGELNCLFATSVAEEGLDIQDCNLVVRFDPCKTIIQYIQSRGRARHKNSTFIHMLEKDNYEDEDRFLLIRECHEVMDSFCRSLPKDRFLQGNDGDLDQADQASLNDGYAIPSTGARLTYDFSLVVLAHFVESIPHTDEDDMTVTYMMHGAANGFKCEVILPEKSPVKCATGRWCPRKSLAKRSAAFEACHMLYRDGYLDDNLLPIYAKQLPALRNARLALSSKSTDRYTVQTKPSLWSEDCSSLPSQLFVSVLQATNDWDRPVAPLALLTRVPLSGIPPISVYRNNGDECVVHVRCSGDGVAMAGPRLEHLTDFTLRCFKDVFNKTFAHEAKSMHYWLAPVSDADTSASARIDWALLEELCGKANIKWTAGMPEQLLADRFWIDPWHGGRRYFSQSVNSSLRPYDELPADCDRHERGPDLKVILDYSISLYKKSRMRNATRWDPSQPVLNAERTLHRLNLLATPGSGERHAVTKAMICPEPLEISRLPPAVAAMALIFPAVIHRIESYLIAMECSGQLGLTLPADLALEAITKDSDNQDEHSGDTVNFQRGMGANYERLEFLGDSFLKMSTTIATYVQCAQSDQYAMHTARVDMLCNKTLFEYAQKHGYQRYIRARAFNRRTWYPKGLKLLEGKGAGKAEEESKQSLGKKTMADVCEALIGAAYVAHVRQRPASDTNFDQAVKAVHTIVENDNHPMSAWSHFARAYGETMPKYQTLPATAAQVELVRNVSHEHDYEFKNARLLACAFKHPTSARLLDQLPSYERLEFLGDSLLDMACVTHLYLRYPGKDPHWLTEHKMPMVCNLFLGALCVKLGFYRHLKYSSPAIMSAITSWVAEAREAEAMAQQSSGGGYDGGHRGGGGVDDDERQRRRQAKQGARDWWQALREPPKCLADMVESYVGAMFVDGGFDYGLVRDFFDKHVLWFFEDVEAYDSFAGGGGGGSSSHPLSRLRGFLDGAMGCRAYRVMVREVAADEAATGDVGSSSSRSTAVAAVVVHRQVVGSGAQRLAGSVRQAKAAAAASAMEELEGLAPFEFRRRFGCRCTGGDGDGEGAGGGAGEGGGGTNDTGGTDGEGGIGNGGPDGSGG